MLAVLTLLIGLATGAGAVGVLLVERLRQASAKKKEYEAQREKLRESVRALKQKETEHEERTQQIEQRFKDREAELNGRATAIEQENAEFRARKISYEEINAENAILKHDLQNIDVTNRKLVLDGERQRLEQERIDKRTEDLGKAYLSENVEWIGSSISANNFSNCKQKLLKVIEDCRGIGLKVSPQQEDGLIADLKLEFEKAVRAAFEREEQARIKAQIREDERRKREEDREIQQLERERAAIQAALDKALADAKDEHNEEIQRLRERLAAAEEKKRAISQAQLTKAGHVYVISNIGSFGEGIYKIGLTRRLEPHDRVRELCSAAVPFPFDMHMMISSNDAPALENAIHRALHKLRINKANPRKEFFKTSIDSIVGIVKEHHGEVQYIADVEALEYRQGLSMSDEDQDYIERVYSSEPETEDVISDDM